MTMVSEGLRTEDKVVVFFDVCSSTRILEDLQTTGNLSAWRNLLIETKRFLRDTTAKSGAEIHKFIGDGWILLFPTSILGTDLKKALVALACFFDRQLKRNIVPLLQNTPDVLGLTFGVDSGPIIRIVMLQKREYIGRPLNVASRLQGAIREKDDRPAYKVLFSKPAFRALGLEVGPHSAKYVTRKLRNLYGGEKYECIKLNLQIPAKCK